MLDFMKIMGAFFLIVLMLRLKVPLYKAMLTSGLALGLVFGLSPQAIALTGAKSLVDLTTITLASALTLIMFLENIMRRTKMLETMVTSLKNLIGNVRIVMAILPALVGLLPSAGGAVFSAPMVEEVSRDTNLSPEKKSFVNYWYRHVWEYIFPLYPSIILAAQITELPMQQLILFLVPYAVAAALMGIPIAFSGEKVVKKVEKTKANQENWISFVGSIYPVIMIILAVLVVQINIAVSIGLVVFLLLLINQYNIAQIKELVQEAFSAEIILMVISVIVFKDILLQTGSVETLPAFFASLGLPPELILILLPFAVGMATGMSQAFVATTFPILLGMSANGVLPELAALAYVSGFMGVMLSPVHLCLILTVEVFRADLGKVYKMLLAPCSLQMVLAVLLFILMR